MVSRRRNCSNWKLYFSHNARTNSIIIYSTTMQQTTETSVDSPVDSEDVNAKSNNSNFSSDCCREGILDWIKLECQHLLEPNEYRIHLHRIPNTFTYLSASISINQHIINLYQFIPLYTNLYQFIPL